MLLELDDASKLKLFAKDFEKVCSDVQALAMQGAFSNEELCLFDEQAKKIKHIAQFFNSLDKDSSKLVADAKDATEVFLTKESRLIRSTSGSQPSIATSSRKSYQVEVLQSNTMQETLNSKVLRRWFLDHVADPFPSRRTKEDLVLTTNALVKSTSPSEKKSTKTLSNLPIDYSQCTLWFINSRRRSHWTDFFRQFAHSDKEQMRRLIDCLRREEDAEEPLDDELEQLLVCYEPLDLGCCQDTMESRMIECRETYTHMMDWLRQITKEQVGDWMDNIIREAKADLKKEKRARRAEANAAIDIREEEEEGREHQKRKLSDCQEEQGQVRRSDRSQRRKMEERRERRDHRQLPSWFHTPHRGQVTEFNDSPAGSSNWTSYDSNLRVPSSSSSDSSLQPSSATSVSVSSLSSYDAFPRPPGSPTLNIRNHKPLPRDQYKLQPKEMNAQMPINHASLYTSNFAAPKFTTTIPTTTIPKPSIVVHPMSSPGHLEEELSGGSRSQMSRSSSRIGVKLEQFSPASSYAELDQLAPSTIASTCQSPSTYCTANSPM